MAQRCAYVFWESNILNCLETHTLYLSLSRTALSLFHCFPGQFPTQLSAVQESAESTFNTLNCSNFEKYLCHVKRRPYGIEIFKYRDTTFNVQNMLEVEYRIIQHFLVLETWQGMIRKKCVDSWMIQTYQSCFVETQTWFFSLYFDLYLFLALPFL